MTPEAQRIAIAEACGTMKWSYAMPEKCVACTVPDYLNDLNAIHEAELEFSRGRKFQTKATSYLNQLYMINERNNTDWSKPSTGECFFYVTAKVSERAEAFLRALNLWKD